MDRQQIEEKIRKLLALARSDNEHEAATALGRAQAIMQRHSIEIADLGADEPEPITESTYWESSKGVQGNLPSWKGHLSQHCARHNGCSIYYHGGRIVIAGRASDVAAARRILAECMQIVERLTRVKAKGRGKSFAHSFRHGVVAQIGREMREESDRLRAAMRGAVTETALVVVDTRRNEAQTWLRERHNFGTPNYGPKVGSGYAEGRRAGAGAYAQAARGKVSEGSARGSIGSGR